MNKELGNKTLRILLTCPECNNSTFMYSDGDWECLACGDTIEVGDLSITPMDEQELAQVGLISKPNIYKVYDDEWEDLMGDEQIREFAILQLCDKAEDFIAEAQEGYQDEAEGKAIETLYNKVVNEDYTNLTMDEIELVFRVFDFDYDRVYIY